ncbi:MAG TPA: GAF domain-containing sensor histidine kinase [bacterium]|nr:GAF domain-containing sensor histidine kinase [bacterium]HOL48272.1 GAF domain-containing sensor histidine kinase [bacterium]HPQ19445.1 GAF domain-containing sensor histidine kinase [bacterium]
MKKSIDISQFSVIDLINVILYNTLEIESVFELVLEYACHLLNVNQGSIMIVDENKENLIIRTVYNKDKKLIGEKIKINESIAGWVYQKRLPVLVNNIENDPYFKKKNDQQYEKKHLLCLPLIIAGNVIGVINFNDKISEDIFTQSDLDIVSNLIKQILYALDQAVQEEHTAKVISDLFNEIVALYQTGEKFLYSQTIDELCENALNIAKEILNVSEVSIWLFDKEKAELILKKGLNFNYDINSVALDKSVIGHSFKNGISIIINRLEEHSFIKKEECLPFEENNFLCVPIGSPANCIGVITAGKKVKSRIYYQTISNDFSDGDRRLLYAVANQLFITYSFLEIKLNLEKKVEERTSEIQKMHQELVDINKRKDEFLSFISHELRSPISIIKSSAELITELESSLAEETKNLLTIINDESIRINKMITDILEFSRIENGKINFDFKEGNINELINKVISQNLPKANNQKISISKELDYEIPNIIIDTDKMYIVINNFVDNAIKYNKENGSVFISSYQDNEFIYVKIQDTGWGIAEESLPHLFKKYYRAYTKSASVKGTGLGLVISKFIVEKHKGSISVESKLDVGTSFIIKLPKNK